MIDTHDLDALAREAPREDERDDVAVEVGPERLAQLLALGQARRHEVEVVRQLAELVARHHGHARVVVARADPLEPDAQRGDRGA